MKTVWRVALVAATAWLAACGGDGGGGDQAGSGAPAPVDDETAVREVVESYFSALANGSYEEACGYLSEEALQQIKEFPGAGGGECEESLSATFSTLPDSELEKLRNPQLGSVEVSGDTATVQTPAQPVPMIRTDDGWKIASLGQPTG